jgi:eukaryotic-like serine/threonine-protein kinase
MSLQPGTRLGAYEVAAAIGAGGMGEVYRALDTKLHRDVAVKLLPDTFARDAERVTRLRREAHALAAINHPNVASIYDFQETPDRCFLVLELVPGPTLDERLRGGPLGPREALGIAAQIACGLEAAHEQGLIHRDLKPANVKLTPDGRVKLLDFGLAKARPGRAAGDAPTERVDLTGEGAVFGTVAYMSPEQLRGLPVDARTDIWSFGCVLYELLTGRRLFGAPTSADVVVAILGPAPSLDSLPAGTPARAHSLLRRCLRPDPRTRLRDIGDARLEIEDLTDDDLRAPGAGPKATGRPLRFERLTDALGINESPALSPDGKMVAFVAPVGDRRQIWVRLLAGGAPLQITRDDADHEQPRWAPDSSTLIYYSPPAVGDAQGMLFELSALGGMPRPLLPTLGGGDISHDGRRLALFQRHDGRKALVVVGRDGSAPQVVADLPESDSYESPRWSPDDRRIVFAVVMNFFGQRLRIVRVEDGDIREMPVSATLSGHAWLPDGSGLAYSSSTGSTVLYPPSFNLRVIRSDGRDDRPITAGDISYIEPDIHPSGRTLACRRHSRSDIWRFPVSGSPAENTRARVRVTRQTGQVQTPCLSPDGRRIVYLSDNGDHGNLWVTGTDGANARQITFERDPAVRLGVPVWSPAGDDIVFLVGREGIGGLGLIHPDGSRFRPFVDQGVGAGWSRDGRWLYYTVGLESEPQLEKRPIAGGAPVRVIDGFACFIDEAPDGSGILYGVRTGSKSADWEIRRRAPDGTTTALGTIPGARLPLSDTLFQTTASPDGQWLATPLVDGETTNLWVMPASGGPLVPLTDFGDQPTMIARRIAWSPDSQYVYAALAETDTDIVLWDGLL